MKKLFLNNLINGFLLVLSLLFVSSSIKAEEDGRYRAIVLHEGGQGNQFGKLQPKVFIMDSREGHMWIFEQNTKLRDPNGQFLLGTVITYQGQLRPGKKAGEVIEQIAH